VAPSDHLPGDVGPRISRQRRVFRLKRIRKDGAYGTIRRQRRRLQKNR